MAQQNEHGRLIAAAAKAALAPLGCKRVRQSRFWYSDQGFWTISIEFQPSGWAKGSYLNVGAMWLWYPYNDWGFSDGYRVEEADFILFESVDQFTPLIATMAGRAAQEILALRAKFKSLTDIYKHLLTRVTREGWPVYHAAVAAGLMGDIAASRQLFDRMARWPTYGYAGQLQLKARSAALAAVLDDPNQFRSDVLAVIEDVRRVLQLPSDPQCLESTDSKAEG